jgi:hypothetical protein
VKKHRNKLVSAPSEQGTWMTVKVILGEDGKVKEIHTGWPTLRGLAWPQAQRKLQAWFGDALKVEDL